MSKFCSKCGKELMDEAVLCPGCGCAVEGGNAEVPGKEIKGKFPPKNSKVPLSLSNNEFIIEQAGAAFVMSSIAQGQFTLTNKRIIFTKDGAGKAFLKRGGLLGMAMSQGANIPSEILLGDITGIQPTSCMQGKAAMLITIRSGYQYKIALQSMSLLKTNELCDTRDRIVKLINSIL